MAKTVRIILQVGGNISPLLDIYENFPAPWTLVEAGVDKNDFLVPGYVVILDDNSTQVQIRQQTDVCDIEDLTLDITDCTTTTTSTTSTYSSTTTTTSTTSEPSYYNYWTNRYSCTFGCEVSPDEVHIYTIESLVVGNVYYSEGYIYIIDTESGLGGNAVLGVIEGPYEDCAAAFAANCATTTTTSTTVPYETFIVRFAEVEQDVCTEPYNTVYAALGSVFEYGTELFWLPNLTNPVINDGGILYNFVVQDSGGNIFNYDGVDGSIAADTLNQCPTTTTTTTVV
jgi:hypothetical protein